jgi:hypothetical protein
MNNPSNLNKLCTLPPIGLADHDIVYAEIDTWLKRVRETPRKVMKYKEANWDQIKKDLENTLTTINNIYEKSDTNILWNTFKNDIINSIESNIPHKLLFGNFVITFIYIEGFWFFFLWYLFFLFISLRKLLFIQGSLCL